MTMDEIPRKQAVRARLAETLLNIQDSLGLSPSDFADMLGVSGEILDDYRGGRADLGIRNLENICSILHVTIDSLFDGSVHLGALAEQFGGNAGAVPDRYQRAIHSKVRSVAGALRYAGISRGFEFSRRILRRLQVRPQHLEDQDAFVSLNLITDVLEEFAREGFSKEHFIHMGTTTLSVYANSTLGKVLASKASPASLYEDILTVHRHWFDSAYTYRIRKLDAAGAVIESAFSEKGLESAEPRKLGSRLVCLHRQGVCSSFLGNIRPYFARVEEKSCLYLGDKECTYHVHWN